MKNNFLLSVSIAVCLLCGYVIFHSTRKVNRRIEQQEQAADPERTVPPQAIHNVDVAMRLAAEQPTAAFKPDFSKPTLNFIETGYHHFALSWSDQELWFYPWLIQRSTTPEFFDPTQLKNNQAADNTDRGTFRWLGINADNYIDLDGLAEDTVYYYRVAAVTNMTAYRTRGIPPAFSTWKYGSATTRSLAEKHKLTYDVTGDRYGAIAGDGLNDYPAIRAAFRDAQKAGGGIVYLPAGVYDLWPVDADVKTVGDVPTIPDGKS